MTMDVCEVASCMDIMFIYKISRSSTPFIGEKLECQREEANEHDPYTVVIVKRIAECTENQGSWPQASQEHLVYFFSKMKMLNVQ